MNITTTSNVLLNDREKLALESQVLSACSNGYDFGYSDDIKIGDFAKHEYAGYTSQLVQKGLLEVHDHENNGIGYTYPGEGWDWKSLNELATS